MREITLEELLEAGCHFGHQVTRHNPKARDFIFEARDNIHIIDLAKTKEGLDEAMAFVRDLGAKNGNFLIVGTKRQAQDIIKEEVKRAKEAGVTGLHFMVNRWVGGILTNFTEITKNLKRMHDLEDRMRDEMERAEYTKREIGLWDKELKKLNSIYEGIVELTAIPDAIFILDTHLERSAVNESSKTGVTTVGVIDTNSDPFIIDYPIPANDDAVGSIKLLISAIIDAWIEGKKTPVVDDKLEEKTSEETKGAEEPKEKKPKSSVKKSAKKEESTVESSPESVKKATKKKAVKKDSAEQNTEAK
jgi:small subunit ribosomal protein S2